jgi:3-methylcrotonyl-CoA carboxylase alpha subunit
MSDGADASRRAAIDDLVSALSQSIIRGPKTNLTFLRDLVDHDDVRAARMDTGLIARLLDGFEYTKTNPRAAAIAARVLAMAPTVKHLDPWSLTDGFQLGGARRHSFALTVDGEPSIAVATWRHGEAEAAVADTEPVWSAARTDRFGAAHLFNREPLGSAGPTEDGAITVFDLGQSWRVEPVSYDASAVEDTGDGAGVRAPINGKLARVFVKVGDVVEKGQRIAVVEAMKMEHVLAATVAGTVQALPAGEGAQVTQGAPIASIAPTTASA